MADINSYTNLKQMDNSAVLSEKNVRINAVYKVV
jgi:hypothetical protein